MADSRRETHSSHEGPHGDPLRRVHQREPQRPGSADRENESKRPATPRDRGGEGDRNLITPTEKTPQQP
jgi:hypothetical protein